MASGRVPKTSMTFFLLLINTPRNFYDNIVISFKSNCQTLAFQANAEFRRKKTLSNAYNTLQDKELNILPGTRQAKQICTMIYGSDFYIWMKMEIRNGSFKVTHNSILHDNPSGAELP